MKNVLDLNFGWRFCTGFRQEYIRTDFKDNTFKLVDIPHNVRDYSSGDAAVSDNAQMFCYRKYFILPPEMRGKRLILRFEGVMGCAAVFINAKPVCIHRGGFTPFECDITDAVSAYKNNGDNLITVAVDCTEREDTYPFGDMCLPAFHGGIYREVRLEAVDDVYVKNARVSTVCENDNWFIDVSGELSDTKSTELKIYLDHNGNRLFGKYILVENAVFSYRMPVTCGIELWSPELPRLYTLVLTTSENDEYRLRFGFREVKFKSDGFYLNGNKIKLIGLERCQNYWQVGAALPAAAQRDDAKLLKELGCNFVRTGATPPSSHFLDACDELGIMVFEELPGRGGPMEANQSGDKSRPSEEWYENMLQTERELIMRDQHHPCIVLWGTCTEGTDEDEKISIKTYKTAMELDGTRQTAGIINISESRSISLPELNNEDVIAVNDNSNIGSAATDRRRLSIKAKQPYFIAGHTGMRFPARSRDEETMLSEQALRHAAALDAALGESGCCGVVGKTLSDFESRPLMGDSDNNCCCGVTDLMRIKKPAAYVYESQSEDHTVLELCSSLYAPDNRMAWNERGDYAVYCFTNCERVELYRNGKFTASFLPDRKRFPNLPHPPVLIDDFIGNLLVSEEHIEPREAVGVKAALLALRDEGDMPSSAKIKAVCAQNKVKYTPAQMSELYNKYFARRFGGAQFRLDGVSGGKVLASIVSGPVEKTGLKINCSRTELVSSVTYDCIRIELVAVDGNGRRLWRRSDAVSVFCEGSVEVIGSQMFALSAGAYAFYVRSKGGKGNASVKLNTETLGSYKIDLTVSRV